MKKLNCFLFGFLLLVFGGNVFGDYAPGRYVTIKFSPQGGDTINIEMTFSDGEGQPVEVYSSKTGEYQSAHMKSASGVINHTGGLQVEARARYDQTRSDAPDQTYYGTGDDELRFSLMGIDVPGAHCDHFDYWDFLQGDLDYFLFAAGEGVGTSDITLSNATPGGTFDLQALANEALMGQSLATPGGLTVTADISLAGSLFGGAAWDYFAVTFGNTQAGQSVTPATPEPGTMMIFGLAVILGVPFMKRRSKQR